MSKPFDLSGFRKSTDGKIAGVSAGFHDPVHWIDTNSYALNYFVSNDFHRGVPLGQVTLLAGESGAGKSFISANIMRNALEEGIAVVVYDTENALTEEWLSNTGIDVEKYTEAGLFMRYQVAEIDALSKHFSELMKAVETAGKDLDHEDRPPVLVIIDSASQLVTRTDIDQFESGNVSKGDMGRQAKALKAFIKSATIRCAEWNVGMVICNHTYASQDMFDPDDKISGGQGIVYASSIVVALKKAKLKEDATGNKITDVKGIRSRVKVMKSRYAKPFESVEVKIPYSSGIDRYSGLVELFEKQGILNKEGNKLKYVDLEGNERKEFRKYFMKPEGKQLLEEIIAVHSTLINPDTMTVHEAVDDTEDDDE